MIENEHQYRVTCSKIENLYRSLNFFNPAGSSASVRIQYDAIKSQILDLQKEIRDYIKRKEVWK